MRPDGEEAAEERAPGHVGVLVDGHVDALDTGLLQCPQRIPHLPPVLPAGGLEVADVDRDVGPPPHGDDLLDGLQKAGALVPHVDHEKPSVGGDHLA